MIIFIIFSLQKTGGKSSAVTRYPHFATVASRMASRAAFCCAHLFTRCFLLRSSCTKKRALNYVENVNKDQNRDRLNFIFVHFSLENEDVYCMTWYKDVYQLFVRHTLILS